MTAQERINTLMQTLGMGPVDLANAAGLQRNRIFDLSRGKVKKISIEVADGINKNFPTVNKEWLIYGIGEMLIPEEETTTQENPYNKLINEQLVLIQMMQQQIDQNKKILDEIHSSRIQEKQEWEEKRELEKSEFRSIIRELRAIINNHNSWGIAAEDTPRSTPDDTTII